MSHYPVSTLDLHRLENGMVQFSRIPNPCYSTPYLLYSCGLYPGEATPSSVIRFCLTCLYCEYWSSASESGTQIRPGAQLNRRVSLKCESSSQHGEAVVRCSTICWTPYPTDQELWRSQRTHTGLVQEWKLLGRYPYNCPVAVIVIS